MDREDDAKLQRLVGNIGELDEVAEQAERRYRFVVEAHPLIGTNREANRKVEETRLREVLEVLTGRGIDVGRIEASLSEDSTKAGDGVSVQAIEEELENR